MEVDVSLETICWFNYFANQTSTFAVRRGESAASKIASISLDRVL